jgi:hypothetical protein
MIGVNLLSAILAVAFVVDAAVWIFLFGVLMKTLLVHKNGEEKQRRGGYQDNNNSKKKNKRKREKPSETRTHARRWSRGSDCGGQETHSWR